MTTTHRSPIGPGLAALMDAAPDLGEALMPRTKAAFDRLVVAVEAEAALTPTRRGSPRTGQRRAATHTHSLRVPDDLWAKLEAKAATQGVSVNQAALAAITAAVLDH